jgi:cytochrome P450
MDELALEHDPATAVVDLAAMGHDFSRDPYAVFAALRARGPVHRVRIPEGGELWLVVGYHEARAALADPRLRKTLPPADEPPPVRASPGVHLLTVDPPDHTRLRKLIAGAFTTRRVAALAPRVSALVDDLLAGMLAAPGGRADLIDAFAFPLPILVICELLGIPAGDRDRFRAWSTTAVDGSPRDEKQAAADALGAYLADFFAARRARPGDDLSSALVRATDEHGDSLTEDELVGMAWLLLVAGHETTVNLIGNGTLALLTHPGELARLRADWSLLDGAVEEILRWDGPVSTSTFRYVHEPAEIAGTHIPAGHAVMIALSDGDRDPDRWEAPDRFDIGRPTGGHLAFGHGVHYCLGAPLARLEGRIALRALFDRVPGLALDADPAALVWRSGVLMRGLRRLPLRWDAPAPDC